MSRLTLLIMAWFATQAPACAGEVDFNRDVKPILAKNCFVCHGPDNSHRMANLRLDLRDAATAPRKKGPAIVPGKAVDSRVVQRIKDADDPMPPAETGNKLTPEQIATIEKWIAQGAAYDPHWAIVKPKRPEPPEIKQKDWPRNSIDPFILAQLEKAGLKPSPEADKYLLLRRVSLDLRGLPPTPREIAEFEQDKSPQAYEKMVDRFLKDPAYGERWARIWLDLARYADSAGYGSDPLRLNIWPYRDWVIKAFNDNMPYDRFTLEQIAGDLLPGSTTSQKMATAFHRNTMTNTEGGTDREEFRVAAVKDRVDTTMLVWMGLTMGCAKCHTHKYDPITQKEYYQLFGVFNQTMDNDQANESPTMPVFGPHEEEKQKAIEARLAELRKLLETTTPELKQEQTKWEAELRTIPKAHLLQISDIQSESKKTLKKWEDGSLRVEGKNSGKDVVTLTTHADGTAIYGFKLEAMPDADVDVDFVLSHFSVRIGEEGKIPVGKIVRIELPGQGKMLSLAEVRVFREGKNIALKGKAKQSSTAFNGPPQLAIDGNTNGDYNSGKSVTHTQVEDNPWWEVELPDIGTVEKIAIWNRTDGGLGTRLADFRVILLDQDRKVAWQKEVKQSPSPSLDLATSGSQMASLVDAYADFTQTGFDAAQTIMPGAGKGWSVGAKAKDSHFIVFLTDKPLALMPGTTLTIRIEHRDLGRFRLSAIADAGVARRATMSATLRTTLDTPVEKRSPQQQEALAVYYRSIAPSLKTMRDEVARLDKEKPQGVALPVMQELPKDRQRKTKIMIKGDFLNLGDEVQPGLPSAFHTLPQGVPNRLVLANWLISPENPLTARVAVNRFWAQLFGKGLVETEEDFGTQGDVPTHPELLDWLATEYIRLGWDTKAMLKLIVTSATYRQSARVTPELLEKDSKNRLYSHGPRGRLEAEMVRDQALALSGLLSKKMGGPSVYPPQPGGLWQAAFNGQRSYPTSTGEDRYRRGLYIIWRRTVPYPSMATFDAPSRETCAIKRVRTNTPLQAFVTLNDPVYVEAAQALARRIAKEGGSSTRERVSYGLKLCLCRPPQEEQVRTLRDLFEVQREKFRKDAKAAKAMATEPLGPLPQGLDEPEMAAWTVVANVLLNLDAVLTK